METQKNGVRTSSKSDKSSPRHRGLKTAAVLAAIGVASLAVAKGLKTPRGRALKKKALTKGRKVLREAKSTTKAGFKRGMRNAASRAR
jgi:hypothetical protein